MVMAMVVVVAAARVMTVVMVVVVMVMMTAVRMALRTNVAANQGGMCFLTRPTPN